MSSPSYLPSLGTRLREVASAALRAWGLWRPRRFVAFPPGAVLVVLDPIEAYRSLFSVHRLAMLARLVLHARLAGVPVVVTRWDRHRPAPGEGDAIDAKGHWSFYVPPGQSSLLLNNDDKTAVVSMRHTNALTHAVVVLVLVVVGETT